MVEVEIINEIDEIEIDEEKIRTDNIIYMSNKEDEEGFNIISFSKDLNTGFLADIFKRDHNNKFIYNGSNLYYYNGTYWKKDDKLNEINNFIDTIFFKSMIKEINKHNLYCMGNLKGKELKQFIDNSYVISKSIAKLRNVNYRKDLIKDIQFKLHNDDIKFDEIPYLFSFNNKVFDLRQNKFIDPKPEYYISMTTGYNYIEEDNKDYKIKELEAIIEQILYTKTHRNLYLTLMATGLIGETLDKFIVVSGTGGNGKSVCSELIQHMMGSYCYIMPNSVLLDNKMSGPSPEKANSHQMRLIITREPPAKDNKNNNILLNCSIIKEMTGNSQINARLCNSNDTKILMKCTLMIETNKKPLLSECTQAMLRRLLDIPFKSSFIENYQYNELNKNGLLNPETTFIKNIFYTSNEFKEKYKFSIFHILAKYAKQYYDNNKIIDIDNEIINRNKLYLQSSDNFYVWFSSNYKMSKDADPITLKEVFEDYKRGDYYLNSTKAEKKQLTYKKFIEEFETNIFLQHFINKNEKKAYIVINHVKTEDNTDDNIEENNINNKDVIEDTTDYNTNTKGYDNNNNKLESKNKSKTINKKIDFDVFDEDIMDEEEEEKRINFINRLNKKTV